MRVLKNLYLTNYFFAPFLVVLVLFALSFPFPFLMILSQASLIILLAATALDVYLLFNLSQPFIAKRKQAQALSLGDENRISLFISNNYNFKTSATIIDELPEQLQERNFEIITSFEAYEKEKKIKYKITPKSRGLYSFGNLNIFAKSPLNLAERRCAAFIESEVPVYPSIIQMKSLELKAFTSISNFQGVKKIRKIGHSYEFDQIKQYIPGDDTRSINWKASSRAADLMVNQYEDERSQPVYCIIDKSRTMKMPFNGLSLLDYAINTSLVISNIVLKKHDKAGLLTFSNKLGNFIKAEKHSKQLNKILLNLYNEKVSWPEADYELLYSAARNFIRGRSLLFLFTNFESVYALERILPLLRKLNQLHLLVVMFFENTELSEFCEKPCANLLEIHQQTAAKELVAQKSQIEQVFQMHGIQSIKTKPENLSLDTINKYLELKARGYI